MKSASKKLAPRFIMLVFGFLIFLCLGSIYSWSIFRKPLERLLTIEPTQSGIPYMLFLAFYALLMPLSGSKIERYGPRNIMVLGGLMVGLGWFLSGYAKNIYSLSLSYGILAGSGVGMVYGAPIAAMKQWFPNKKGLVVGIILSGFGLSPFVTAPLSEYIIAHYGIRWAFRGLGILFAVLLPLLSLPFRFPLEYRSTINQREMDSFIHTRKDSAFKGLWFCFFMATAVGLTAIGMTSPVGEEMFQLGPGTTALYISFFAICNALGRPVFGGLTDLIRPFYTALLSYALMLIATLLILFSTEGRSLAYAWGFAILWLNLGAWLAIVPTATAIYFGKKRQTRVYGYIFTAYGAGAVLGVSISGEIRRLSGSYRYVLYLLILLILAGCFAAMKYLMPLKHKNESTD